VNTSYAGGGGQMIWFGIILIVITLVVFINATEKTKYGEFDHASWWLLSLGIYQWGQALVLGVFWILFGLACMFWWTPAQALFSYITFHVIRAGLEILLTFQDEYRGLLDLLPHSNSKISGTQRMQLYRLSQGLIIIVGMVLLLG
jgi:hypothetical protein